LSTDAKELKPKKEKKIFYKTIFKIKLLIFLRYFYYAYVYISPKTLVYIFITDYIHRCFLVCKKKILFVNTGSIPVTKRTTTGKKSGFTLNTNVSPVAMRSFTGMSQAFTNKIFGLWKTLFSSILAVHL
jgi:hypothetical protein